jgi:hypothetical protein
MMTRQLYRFLRELKQVCLSTTEPGNKPFWDAVKKLGTAMTLIGKSEATKAVSINFRVTFVS